MHMHMNNTSATKQNKENLIKHCTYESDCNVTIHVLYIFKGYDSFQKRFSALILNFSNHC